jgi:ribosome-associated protein
MSIPSTKKAVSMEAIRPIRAARALGSRVASEGSRRGKGALARSASLEERLESGRRIARLAAAAGLDKKAEDIQIIDVVGKVDYAEYLVLMTGSSDRHVAAIARGIEEDLRLQGVRTLALEGLPLARWVLIDLVDVVVHVFQSEWRGVYDLDGLWMDAARLPLSAPAPSA